jgi:hypothetical protein
MRFLLVLAGVLADDIVTRADVELQFKGLGVFPVAHVSTTAVMLGLLYEYFCHELGKREREREREVEMLDSSILDYCAIRRY